jgi:hypothetical protein
MKAHNPATGCLVLIGTVHNDPLGYDKLILLLASLQPGIITLELSPYGRGFRSKHARKLSRRIRSYVQALQKQSFPPAPDSFYDRQVLPSAILQLLAAVTFPFEYCAARDYASTRRIPLYCIDLSHISRMRLRMLKHEALTGQNIAALFSLPDKNLLNSVNLCYKRAAAVWDENNCLPLLPAALDSTDSERDEHMGRRLRTLCKRFPRKIIVHIAGWEHCADSSGTLNLYGMLRDISPRRILLYNGWQSCMQGFSCSLD